MTGPWTTGVSRAWHEWRRGVDLDEYDTRWDRLAADGHDVHGEADAVERLGGGRVLDAGCGTGRVAIELARRGHDVVGVDADADLLARARRRAPRLRWIHGDISRVDLGQHFDVVVVAGDVLSYVAADRRAAAVKVVGRHLDRDGVGIIGGAVGGATAAQVRRADLDRWVVEAGLSVRERWSTWGGDADDGGGYLVAVVAPAPVSDAPSRRMFPIDRPA